MTMRTEIQEVKARSGYVEVRVAPETLNEEKRTLDLIWSTGAQVLRSSFFEDDFIEQLSMKKEHVRLDRLNNGAPLLNTHNRFDLRDVIGVVTKALIVSKQGRATVQFSRRDDVAEIFQDVQDGVIRNVSIGYRVFNAERHPPAKAGERK